MVVALTPRADGHPHQNLRRTSVTTNANASNIIGKSYTITAEVTVPQGGDDDVIVANGGRCGCFGMYLLKGKAVFNYNVIILAQ